ncbi:MAG: phenylpyruvate tautomerase MIF-related protein [Verrucomicrobiota bacterium]
MPFLSVQTNQEVDPQTRQKLLTVATQQVSSVLGKSEEYFMASLQTVAAMRFGGSAEPTAMFDLKALEFPSEKAQEITNLLCKLSADILNVEKARTYVTFTSVERGMWGWNDKVF